MERYSHDEAEWAPYEFRWPCRPTHRRRAGAHHRRSGAYATGCRSFPAAPAPGSPVAPTPSPAASCVSFERMTAVLRIDPVERLAVVQPGVVNDDLRAACAEHGLWYPPDPASSPWSTIGGNVATNAGGRVLREVRRHRRLRPRPRGRHRHRRARARRPARRPRASPATTSSPCWSARRAPSASSPRSPSACARPALLSTTVVGVLRLARRRRRGRRRGGPRGHSCPPPSSCSTATACTAVNDWKNLGIEADCEAILLGPRRRSRRRWRGRGRGRARRASRRAGATFAARSEDDAEADAMFAARRLAYSALERLGPVLTEDVCVPVGRRARDARRASQTIGERHDVLIANIAHAGDGNLHPLIITPPGDDAARRAGAGAFDDIIAEAFGMRRHRHRRARCRPAQARRPRSRALRWQSSTCTARSGGRSTRTECSTPGRSSAHPLSLPGACVRMGRWSPPRSRIQRTRRSRAAPPCRRARRAQRPRSAACRPARHPRGPRRGGPAGEAAPGRRRRVHHAAARRTDSGSRSSTVRWARPCAASSSGRRGTRRPGARRPGARSGARATSRTPGSRTPLAPTPPRRASSSAGSSVCPSWSGTTPSGSSSPRNADPVRSSTTTWSCSPDSPRTQPWRCAPPISSTASAPQRPSCAWPMRRCTSSRESRRRASDLRDVLNEVVLRGGGLPAVVAALDRAAALVVEVRDARRPYPGRRARSPPSALVVPVDLPEGHVADLLATTAR